MHIKIEFGAPRKPGYMGLTRRVLGKVADMGYVARKAITHPGDSALELRAAANGEAKAEQ